MNGRIDTDLKSIKFIFERNKFYIAPVTIMLICVILFFQFILPQFNMIFTAKENAREDLLKLDTLEENLRVLSGVDESSLDAQLEILNLALPSEKDFDGILNSINSSGVKAGAILGAYSFAVGDLSGVPGTDKFPTIQLSVPVNSDASSVNEFLGAISKSLPLSEISLVRIGGKTSTVNLSFYYKPAFSGSFKNFRISPLSPKGLSLIEQLRGFK